MNWERATLAALAAAVCALGVWLWRAHGELEAYRGGIGRAAAPDTVRKRAFKPDPIPYGVAEPPRVVVVYESRDTALRKSIEEGDAIAQVQVDRRMLTITTVSPDGTVRGAEYSLKDIRRGVVAHDGTARFERRAKRRKVAKRVAVAAAAAGAVVAAILLAK